MFHFARNLALVACVLLLSTPGRAAAAADLSWINSQEAVSEIIRVTDRLQSRLDAAEQMLLLQEVNQRMETQECRRESEALDRAQSPSDIDRARGEAERCYRDKLAGVVARYPSLPPLHSFEEISGLYRELMQRHFAGEGDVDFRAVRDQTRSELQEFREETDALVGIVTAVSPSAVLRGITGTRRMAHKGTRVTLQDSVITDQNGLVRFELLDYLERYNLGPTVVDIGSDTEVRVERFVRNQVEERTVTFLELIKGTFKALVTGWRRGSVFSVRAGTTLCGSRGTEFEMHFDPDTDTTTILLYKGRVEIETPYEKFLLEAGHQVTVERGYSQPIRPLAVAPPT